MRGYYFVGLCGCYFVLSLFFYFNLLWKMDRGFNKIIQ